MDEQTVREQGEEGLSLEEHFKRLEEQISCLEKPEISLEEAFARYKEGLDELKEAKGQLDAIEQTMLIMNSDGSLEEFQ